MPWSVGENRDAILALVKGLNIPIIDIHQAFRAHADSLRLFPFRRPGHYNEEGHLLVAETVLRHLSSHSSGCEPSGSRLVTALGVVNIRANSGHHDGSCNLSDPIVDLSAYNHARDKILLPDISVPSGHNFVSRTNWSSGNFRTTQLTKGN
jgi:hypothetical protein